MGFIQDSPPPTRKKTDKTPDVIRVTDRCSVHELFVNILLTYMGGGFLCVGRTPIYNGKGFVF